MLNVTIKTIPHSEQRYETAGDWQYDHDAKVSITISDCGDRKYEWLLALHELIEYAICDQKRIMQSAVDRFDTSFNGDGEPGDDPACPYRDAHCYATAVERMLCAAFGMSWKEYDDFVAKLGTEAKV